MSEAPSKVSSFLGKQKASAKLTERLFAHENCIFLRHSEGLVFVVNDLVDFRFWIEFLDAAWSLPPTRMPVVSGVRVQPHELFV